MPALDQAESITYTAGRQGPADRQRGEKQPGLPGAAARPTVLQEAASKASRTPAAGWAAPCADAHRQPPVIVGSDGTAAADAEADGQADAGVPAVGRGLMAGGRGRAPPVSITFIARRTR